MARQDEMQSYWDQKIARWDDSAYDREGSHGLMGRMRSSVDARMNIALEVLKTHTEGKSLLDLGCGAGRLAILAVDTLGAARAHGIDISPAAVEKARSLAERAGVADRVTFEVGSVARETLPEADITVGLGLLDWLDDEETERLMTSLEGRRFLLSYSEQDNSLAEIVHRFYLVYRLRLFGGAVRARHHRRRELLDLMDRHGLLPCEIIERREARFGKLIHNLRGMRVPVPRED
jgi:SAM-dependent methyltransferase